MNLTHFAKVHSFETLPVEMTLYIIGFLPLHEQIGAKRTCMLWNNIITQHLKLPHEIARVKKYIYLNVFEDAKSADLLKRVSNSDY